jgi:hypothetical protein
MADFSVLITDAFPNTVSRQFSFADQQERSKKRAQMVMHAIGRIPEARGGYLS